MVVMKKYGECKDFMHSVKKKAALKSVGLFPAVFQVDQSAH
jgi:hypothetical protein